MELAKQTAALSNSKAALYERDYPTLSMRKHDCIPFSEVKSEVLDKLREKLGLQPWDTSESA